MMGMRKGGKASATLAARPPPLRKGPAECPPVLPPDGPTGRCHQVEGVGEIVDAEQPKGGDLPHREQVAQVSPRMGRTHRTPTRTRQRPVVGGELGSAKIEITFRREDPSVAGQPSRPDTIEQ